MEKQCYDGWLLVVRQAVCGGWSPSCHGLGRYTTRHGRTRYPGPNLVRLQTLEEERDGNSIFHKPDILSCFFVLKRLEKRSERVVLVMLRPFISRCHLHQLQTIPTSYHESLPLKMNAI